MDVGKRFEEDFFKSFPKDDDRISIDRVYDNTGGYAGIAGYCDFNVYMHPHVYHFELKHTYAKSLPFNAITERQMSGMLKKAEVMGVFAGIIVQFDAKLLREQFFMNIQTVKKLQDFGDRKSISIEQFSKYGIPLNGYRLRTRDTFYVVSFLEEIARKGEKKWKLTKEN